MGGVGKGAWPSTSRSRSEVGGRRSEVGGRRSEVGGRRSEVRGQRSEVRNREVFNISERLVCTLDHARAAACYTLVCFVDVSCLPVTCYLLLCSGMLWGYLVGVFCSISAASPSVQAFRDELSQVRLPPTTYLLPPVSYLLTPTSYRLPPTAYLLPPTSYLLLASRSSTPSWARTSLALTCAFGCASTQMHTHIHGYTHTCTSSEAHMMHALSHLH